MLALGERVGAQLSDAIICVSHDERAAGARAAALGRAIVEVIPNGVAVPERPVPVRDSPTPVIGTIARLSRQKGIDILIDALPGILEHWPAARCVVVGTGPLEEQLRERAVRRGVSASITFRLDLVGTARTALDDFDLFVLPSRWEGMPIALLEAAAAGLPCIATDVGGIREILRDGVSGRVVGTSPAAIAEAAVDALGAPATRERWGAAARAHVSEAFPLERMVAATEALYLRAALADDLRHG
jgi:glycosyltransferase involved in cell wall biosynthesis